MSTSQVRGKSLAPGRRARSRADEVDGRKRRTTASKENRSRIWRIWVYKGANADSQNGNLGLGPGCCVNPSWLRLESRVTGRKPMKLQRAIRLVMVLSLLLPAVALAQEAGSGSIAGTAK